MFKHVRRVGAGIGIVGVPVMAFATHSIPETIKSADGTIYNNLKYLGIDRPPSSIATSATDHAVAIVAGAMILFGALCALSWAWDWFRKGRDVPINKDGFVVSSLKAQSVDLSQGKVSAGGDAYINNGTNNGHMGPKTENHFHGKQPFQMTATLMDQIAKQLGSPRPISVDWVGSQRSKVAADELVNYLNGKGFHARNAGGSWMLLPPLESPIEWRDGVLMIDADK